MFYFLIWLSKCKAALFEVDIIGKSSVYLTLNIDGLMKWVITGTAKIFLNLFN